MGTVQTKDLIKTKNTKLRNKDKQGKYKPSTFKFFWRKLKYFINFKESKNN